jgi:Amt family ammonium transporter
MAIGLVAGAACFFGATKLKQWGGYDDSLDAFGVHGIGGLLGTLMLAVFAAEEFGGQVKDLDIAKQFGVQALCAGITAVWSVGVSFLLLKAIDRTIGLRPDEQEERTGLDLSLHNESGYNY